MGYQDLNVIIERFNNAVEDIALAEKARRLDENRNHIKHRRDAGEAISQTLELSLKHHVSKHISRERHHELKRINLPSLIQKFSPYKGNSFEGRNPDLIDFRFLEEKKAELTNNSKHKGEAPLSLDLQKKYLEEVRKVILCYITENESILKTVEHFEKLNTPLWDRLYIESDCFSGDERNYILVIGKLNNSPTEYLESLGIPKWDLVIDFDYSSREDGFFSSAFKNRPNKPHIVNADDIIGEDYFSIFSSAHYHYFINGYKGGGIQEERDYKNWYRKYEQNTDRFFRNYSGKFSTQKTVVIILYESRRFVNLVCAKIEKYFGDSARFIFAHQNDDDLGPLIEDFDGIHVPISVGEISEGISNYSSNFGRERPVNNSYILPFLRTTNTEGVTGVIDPEFFARLEEDFDVLHKGLPILDFEEDRRDFLCGLKKISWNGIAQNYDIVRPDFRKNYIKPVERALEQGKGKIRIVHGPGYGGTTVGRRIAWEFHNDYPTLILKRFRGQKTIEKVIRLHQLTRKTILIILEAPQSISLDDIDSFYNYIQNRIRPIVFLVVQRGRPWAPNDLVVPDWGNNVGYLINAYKPYLKELHNPALESKKLVLFNELANSSESYQKTPFYVGLITFEERFYAIKDFVGNFVRSVLEKEEQKKVLLYLAICDDYLGEGLNSSFLASVVRSSSKIGIFKIEDYLPEETIGTLLNSENEKHIKYWKPRHPLFSNELKKQLLAGNSQNPEVWKQNLAEYCICFINDSQIAVQNLDYAQELLQKLFIGTRKDRAGETFTTIIQDIDSSNDKGRVFLALHETFPENPHFCSHLARFYAYFEKNRELALKYSSLAIRLSEIEGNADSLLYHIKGMCIRQAAFDLMEQLIQQKKSGEFVQQEQVNEIIEQLIPEAALEFEKSREISKKQGRNDEHGYVAHIQMLTKAIDFGAIMSNLSKGKFLASNKDPYGDWLDLAETLLEKAQRLNIDEDESGKITGCENQVLDLYEDYGQIIQNLRNLLDKGKNPIRTRRQLVRTYFRKEAAQLKGKPKIVDIILGMMEKNIENEPENGVNFFLWFKAARFSSISIEDALSKVAKWNANSGTVDVLYYFYILKVIRGIEGFSDEENVAKRLIEECSKRSPRRGDVTICFEWLGKGGGLDKLVSKKELLDEDKEETLEYQFGYVTEYKHDGYGEITIENTTLKVFFSPRQAGLTEECKNEKVRFFLGFSFSGLRADSPSVRLM